jgi:hypothetical protein
MCRRTNVSEGGVANTADVAKLGLQSQTPPSWAPRKTWTLAPLVGMGTPRSNIILVRETPPRRGEQWQMRPLMRNLHKQGRMGPCMGVRLKQCRGAPLVGNTRTTQWKCVGRVGTLCMGWMMTTQNGRPQGTLAPLGGPQGHAMMQLGDRCHLPSEQCVCGRGTVALNADGTGALLSVPTTWRYAR